MTRYRKALWYVAGLCMGLARRGAPLANAFDIGVTPSAAEMAEHAEVQVYILRGYARGTGGSSEPKVWQ
jgi:hypothetical protein